MRKLLLASVFCLFTSITIQADPFVILPNGELAFNTSFTTQGVFTCTLCTGSGTNSVVFGSGANTLMVTFTGVNSTILVGAEPVPTIAGQIEVVATGTGFVFPTGSNPNVQLLFFTVIVTQSSPAPGTDAVAFSAFGGGTSLILNTLISNFADLPAGPNPPGFSYTRIVYTFSPFTIPNTNALVNVTADVSAIPEPASVLLLGSGVGMMLTLWARRFSKP